MTNDKGILEYNKVIYNNLRNLKNSFDELRITESYNT